MTDLSDGTIDPTDMLCTTGQAAARLGVPVADVKLMIQEGDLVPEFQQSGASPALLRIGDVDKALRRPVRSAPPDDGKLSMEQAAKIIGIPATSLYFHIYSGVWILDVKPRRGPGNSARIPAKEVALVAALVHIGVGQKDAIQLAQSGRVRIDAAGVHIANL